MISANAVHSLHLRLRKSILRVDPDVRWRLERLYLALTKVVGQTNGAEPWKQMDIAWRPFLDYP